jgi:hypothetical protein
LVIVSLYLGNFLAHIIIILLISVVLMHQPPTPKIFLAIDPERSEHSYDFPSGTV